MVVIVLGFNMNYLKLFSVIVFGICLMIFVLKMKILKGVCL